MEDCKFYTKILNFNYTKKEYQGKIHKDSRMIDLQNYPASRFWMRAVSFVGLRNLIALVKPHSKGITVKDLTNLVIERRPFLVKNQLAPSKTTIYHYRNTLMHLGILVKFRGRLFIDWSNSEVTQLVNNMTENNGLSDIEKKNFGLLVLRQEDCKTFFTDLFNPDSNEISQMAKWEELTEPAIWSEDNQQEGRAILLRSWNGNKEFLLSKENHIQSILYGVRYWFRNELGLIDEIFKEDIGNIMFPTSPVHQTNEQAVVAYLIDSLHFDQDWALLSVRETALSICVKLRIPVEYLFGIIRSLHRKYPGYIVFIPTSRSFATITASSTLRETYELKSYLKDDRGVYISHLRIHHSIREQLR